MSSKTEQLTRRRAYGRTGVFKEYRASFLIILSIAVLFILVQEVEAQETPTQVIVFTDKTVYKDFYMQQGRGSGNIPAYVALETDDFVIYSYAIVLDDDGNIMKGLTGINGILDDTKRLDHYHKNDDAYHHNITLNPNFYNNINLVYNDTGTFGDGIAGDGIYTAFINIADATATQANDILDDHLVLNISASFNNLTSYTEVLYSGMACHNGQSESHGTHTASDVSPSSNGPSPCTICHRGMEHFFENQSTDQNGDPTFPYSKLDVHSQKIQPNYTVRGGNQALTVIWNLSKTGGTAWGGKGAHWETNMPGSSSCYICHYATAGGSLLDYGSGDRTNLADRPSCSVAGKSLNGVSESVACHSVTKIEGESTLNWTDPAASVGAGTSLNATWKAKSHNQSNPPNKANVSCAICHGRIHQFKLPNSSVTGEDYLDIDNQCILCHNISGGLNITANGGKNANHTNPNCKACHLNDNLKLDAHFMPAEKYPDANCTQCHDLGGRALLHIDLDIFNNSDYVHNMYNESKGQRPLNFNASNGTALRPSENKICWGCHGDDPDNDGKANFSEQPSNGHPSRYNNARRCEECHQNASSPWGAPQNVAHSYNTAEVRTPGAPNCYDCHGQPIMFNNSHKDTDINESNEKGIKASFANHYGTGFPELAASRGNNGYCIDFCHQNTSSPFLLEFSNKDNMQRPNHSAMTSRPQNQSCRAEQCHAADAIHDEKMRKPTLAGGTFGNANCTASGCHSPADSGGLNYSYHNNVVNCTSCHMNNIGSNIHPIKYLQNDGTDFAQVQQTAASCKLCHYNGIGNEVMEGWGVTPRTIGAQHHSTDLENGSKWNTTIDPFWDYTPSVITFANGWVTNSSRGFMTDFEALKDTNYSAARISENTTQDSFVGNYPPNHEFNDTLQAGGWYSNGTATTKAWSNLPGDGNPNGSIIVGSTTRSQVVDANWTAAFVYNKTGRVADARIKLNSKLIKGKSLDTTRLKAINITIDDKYGNITEVFNRSLPDVPEVDWSIDERSIPDPDSVFWKNGTLDHTYNVTIRTRWTNINGERSPDIKVAYDNIFVNVSEVDYKKYNFTFYINETPGSDRYNLVIGYQTHTEPARLYVKNASGFNYRKDLDSGAFTKVIIPLSTEEYGSGNITLRINDSNGPGESVDDVNEIDVKPDYIDIEYMFVESYKWINGSRVNYPCEYCHAPNKHSRDALGIPYFFKGDNNVGQNVNSSTTWCASCHYKGYSSGSMNYANMTQTFIDHFLPVPPEITGHFLYGVNKTQSSDYYEHSGLGSFDDLTCWRCHKGELEDGSTSTEFMHNVSIGKSGGKNCTACHDPGSGVDVPLVNFTSLSKGMHASLNAKASSSPENASNKPCWACHGTLNGEWANETDQASDHDPIYQRSARKCYDCHNDTQPLFEAKNVTDHIPSGLSSETDVSTSKHNSVYCALCHNNSVGESFDPDGLGRSPMNASASHYGTNKTANMLMAQGSNSTECVFCHRNSSNMIIWGIIRESPANISNKNATSGGTDHTAYTSSSQCSACHGGYAITSAFTFHDGALGNGSTASGGPDCKLCHDVNGAQNNVNFSAMNDNDAIHRNLNSDVFASDNTYNESKKCWACHGDGSQPSGHPTKYKTPSNCADCHTNSSTPFAALQVSQHFWNGTSINTAAITTCYDCHNTSEMMLGTNLDPDGAGSIYGGANGGSSSVSHYGKKRQDYQSIQDTNDYCTGCHNNASTVFPFMDNNNKTIANHSVNYPSTNPGCADCHFTGRLHDSTLTNPTFSLSNSTLCESCHGLTGSAAIKDKEKHNSTMECSQCHLNSTRNIHPVQYLQQDRISWETSKANAVNCTNCHQSGFSNAPIIPDPLKHSNNLSNGSLWNSTPYWTSGTDSCYYCHDDTKHNSSALGKISLLLTNPNNTRKGDLTTTTWCADCHYSDASNTNYKGDYWNPTPPLITENNTGKDYWINHSGYLSSGYKDKSCENCHAINGSSSKDSNNYSHSLGAGMEGGPDCIFCHDIGGLAPKTVNITDLRMGIHNNLNGADTDVNRSCYACHGDGNAPESGHPVEYKTPKKCADCHSQGNYSAPQIQNHIPPKLPNDPGRIISTNAYCTDCHNNSINNFAYTRNGSVSHYGTNTSILKPTVNQTILPASGFFTASDASDHNKECNNCHKNYPFNQTYGNATQIDYGHTSTAACDQCHVTMSASDLHNGSLIIPQTFNCLDCHSTNSSKYKAPNISGTIMATYPATSCESNGCHGQGVTNGLLDTLNKHNIDRNFSGTPGTTGMVYLNGQTAITVTNGIQVIITATVNDISGGNYYASRVGGAEYYVDVDPGVGKGIALNATDGYYDAVNGGLENVTGTIETTGLSVGTHTVYVRGMDTGKQWSASSNATLTIKSSISYTPPAPVSLTGEQGNFWINYTWQAGTGNITDSFNISVNDSWTNGTNISYSNNSVQPHGWSNISVWAYNNSGNGSLSLTAVSNNTQLLNNIPVQAQIGNKTIAEGSLLTFTVSATDIDSDILVNATNATKGIFNPATGQFTWTPGYADQGIYVWNFNSSDNFGGTTDQTITVTVINVPLSITSSTPVTDPISTESAVQSFTISLNRTSNVTWYMNGSIVKTNTSVITSNYANSTAGIGVYNITAIADDGFDTVMRKWNWTVTAIPTYQVSGYVFDNYGIGLGDVLVLNDTHQDTTSPSGQYSITGLINGTYNFSFSRTGFNTKYLEVTINGSDIINANNTIYDTTPPGQVTGLINDTPTLTTVNLTWNSITDANYYQVFRNASSLGYTSNAYWNDSGLTSSTLYQYMIRANDTYDNWGQNSSVLDVYTATPDTTPPASVYDPVMATGNFYINNTWTNPADIDLHHVWFRYSNGTTLQNVTKPTNYLNLTSSVRYTQNISAQTVDTLGNINQTLVWFNITIPNNPPVQLPIGSKTITENQVLEFTVISTDADSDIIEYGTNATKGTFNTSTGQFSWTPTYGDAGVYIWYFNSSDIYGGVASETITVTVNADPLGNCLSCHDSNGNPAIIQQSFGMHLDVNTAQGHGVLNNSDCMTCHYDISNMFQQGFTTETRTCTDCHTQGNFSAPIIKNHRPGEVNITTNASCSACHNNSISAFNYNSNASVSHYGTTSSLLKPTVNQTVEPVFGFMIPEEASEHNSECSSCHNPSNSSYGNATLITSGHTATATCDQCHLNANASNLHDGSLIKPVTSSCRECHMIYADIYKAPNLTNTIHNHPSYSCSTYQNCHISDERPDYTPQGRLDPSDHNTDFTLSPGNPPTADPVSLNDSPSLTVFKGENVAVSSRIRDNPYTASRVRGAEYYIDSDPGPGKGTVMSAADGYFDASGGAWENISANIDTYNLTPGTHTVYVRGMDIGKQWSTSVAATLIILDSRGFVNGTVRNSSGYGIAGATVITNTGEFVKTDSNGFYSLDLTIGTYNLTATREPEFYANNTFSSVTITRSTGEIRDAILALKPTGTISGVVTN